MTLDLSRIKERLKMTPSDQNHDDIAALISEVERLRNELKSAVSIMKTDFKDCIIVDLDGTVADCEHRLHFIERKPKNWEAFLDPANIFNDPLIESIANVVRIFSQHYAIVYCSGRSAAAYDITVDWLKKHNLWNSPVALYMRKKGDKRPDFEIKAELLHKMRKEGWNPILVLDDRDSVVSMWREQGLTCLQVAEGNF